MSLICRFEVWRVERLAHFTVRHVICGAAWALAKISRGEGLLVVAISRVVIGLVLFHIHGLDVILILDQVLIIAIITAIRLVVLLSVQVVLCSCYVRHLHFIGGFAAYWVRLIVHLSE